MLPGVTTLVFIGLVHQLAEGLDEVVAEVLDEACSVRELVTDERKRDSEDFPVEGVLQAAQEEIDAVNGEADVVEETEVAEVDLENVRGNIELQVVQDIQNREEGVLGTGDAL